MKKLNIVLPVIFFIVNLIPFIYDLLYNRSIWMWGWLITSVIWFFIAIFEIIKYYIKNEKHETTNDINNENIGR